MFMEPASRYNKAIVGIVSYPNKEDKAVLYDESIILNILENEDGMDEDEAREYFDFNISGAYVGPKTPIFLVSSDLEEMVDVMEIDIEDDQLKHAIAGVISGFTLDEPAIVYDTSKIKKGDNVEEAFLVDKTIQALKDFRAEAIKEEQEILKQKSMKL